MVTVGAGDGTVRYALLETLRHYGAEHLGDGPEAEAVHRAHAQHYTSVAEQADRGPARTRRGRLGERRRS